MVPIKSPKLRKKSLLNCHLTPTARRSRSYSRRRTAARRRGTTTTAERSPSPRRRASRSSSANTRYVTSYFCLLFISPQSFISTNLLPQTKMSRISTIVPLFLLCHRPHMKFSSMSARWSMMIGPGWIQSSQRHSLFSSGVNLISGFRHMDFQLLMKLMWESQMTRFGSSLYTATSSMRIALRWSTVSWSKPFVLLTMGYCWTSITFVLYWK